MNNRSLFVLMLSIVIALALFASIGRFLRIPSERPRNEEHLSLGECSGTITILYDNNPYDPRLRTAWGFSCLIELDDATILFDTGGDGGLLTENMAKLGVDASDIQFIIISHIHGDHTGGLGAILEGKGGVSVYLPYSFPSNFKEDIKAHGAEVVEVKRAIEICECAAITGVLGTGIKEQSLMVKTGEGLVVVTGCAHPGIVNITREAKALTGDEVYLVIGGFHLASKSEKQIVSAMRELGVRKVAPCHCSGDTARRLFEESFVEDYVEAGVGKVLHFP